MYNLIKQSGHAKYNLSRFVCDTIADLPSSKNLPQGSSAFVLEDQSVYFLLSDGEWQKIN